MAPVGYHAAGSTPVTALFLVNEKEKVMLHESREIRLDEALVMAEIASDTMAARESLVGIVKKERIELCIELQRFLSAPELSIGVNDYDPKVPS